MMKKEDEKDHAQEIKILKDESLQNEIPILILLLL